MTTKLKDVGLEPEKFVRVADAGEGFLDPAERWEGVKERNATVSQLCAKYAGLIDERLIRDPRSVFQSDEKDLASPFSFVWVPDGTRQRMIRSVQEIHTEYLAQGYRPVKLTDVEDYIVIGEDALLLIIPRNNKRFVEIKQKNKVAVPELPKHLKGKFGFAMPPTVDKDGYCWVGQDHRLWYVEREIIVEQQRLQSLRANRITEAKGSLKNALIGQQEQSVLSGVREVTDEELKDFFAKME
jgi:hypothetical protein